MIINSNLKNVASILLATFLFLNSYSQEAEKIYHEDYSKLSFVFQPSRITGFYSANTNGSSYPSITFDDSGSLQFGIYALAILNEFGQLPIQSEYHFILLNQYSLSLPTDRQGTYSFPSICSHHQESFSNRHCT